MGKEKEIQQADRKPVTKELKFEQDEIKMY